MCDSGRQAVLYQALVQFVEVTQNGNWSIGLKESFSGFRRATIRACLTQSLGKRDTYSCARVEQAHESVPTALLEVRS